MGLKERTTSLPWSLVLQVKNLGIFKNTFFFFFKEETNWDLTFFVHCLQRAPQLGDHMSWLVYINSQNMKFAQNLWFLLPNYNPTTLRELCPAVAWTITSLMPMLVPAYLHWILSTWKVYKIIWGMRQPSLLVGFSQNNVSGGRHQNFVEQLSCPKVPTRDLISIIPRETLSFILKWVIYLQL